MRFMFLIHGDRSSFEQMTLEQQRGVHLGHHAFQEEVRNRGIFVDGAPLDEAPATKTVRGAAGKPLVTDGPFAETKEVLGGYYVLDCKDYDEAIELGKKIHAIGGGTVEVLRIVEVSELVVP
jgi:hypothetical protein